MLFNDTLEYNIMYGGINDEQFRKDLEDPKKRHQMRETLIETSKKAQIYDFVCK